MRKLILALVLAVGIFLNGYSITFAACNNWIDDYRCDDTAPYACTDYAWCDDYTEGIVCGAGTYACNTANGTATCCSSGGSSCFLAGTEVKTSGG